MNWQHFGSRLGPWILLICLAALVLSVAAATCFGGLMLCFIFAFVSALAAYEGAVVLSSDSPRTSLFFLLALFPPLAVLISFARLGVCGPDILGQSAIPTFGVALLLVIALLFAGGILRGLTQRETTERWFSGIFPGILFIAAGGGSLCAITALPDPSALLGWMILVTAANDTFAYLFGSALGGKKMAPSISPSKTWTGSAGGLAGSLLFGIAAGSFLMPQVSHINIALISLLVGIGGQIGDLIASYLKRFAGKKDFGTLLGSHGGILDRIDSHFGAAMLFLVALELLR